MDWLLSKMRLVDDDIDEPEEPETDEIFSEKSWLELIHRKKYIVTDIEERVFFKNVLSYEDCKLIITNCKEGAACIYRIGLVMNTDAQGMMNYICGGVYALGGDVKAVGDNVFVCVILS